ncbi:hypothetical protein [Bradyrhizobium diazoefficiens]|uniref:hypothetical protein n=1 Tax=Bradyrhizobium diazoefficiens TaxID=1355477 RepID=UPI00272BAAA7|nr:hypothetical protein [Bradyrhizobium diazoefficiens]WLA64861.1 hypothetical protein QNN01_42545 [Bradyrhizobium diazoefficiens]WLA64876.1 hypothetical protein QNN01_42650 [Bradyrhizobium diazoefficiens]WLA64885.1 hypothetical protein QNN01_42740 [Bradyrhizobium diazoefficiens]
MITEEDFATVADCPPDLAFARLEKKFRHRLENNLENSQNNNSWAHYIIECAFRGIVSADFRGS